MQKGICRHILFVDDDPDDLLLVREVLRELPGAFELKDARNGAQALHYLDNSRQHLPCLIVLDVNMPIMNGRETLRLIKADKDFENIPIVGFTTSSSDLDRVYFEKYDVEMFTKPPSFVMLRDTLLRLLQNYGVLE